MVRSNIDLFCKKNARSVTFYALQTYTIPSLTFYRPQFVAKVIFLHLSVILFTGGGVSASVHAGIPPPWSRTLWKQTPPRADPPEQTPQEQTPPWSKHPPEQTPPGSRPCQEADPAGKQTPAYGQ